MIRVFVCVVVVVVVMVEREMLEKVYECARAHSHINKCPLLVIV